MPDDVAVTVYPFNDTWDRLMALLARAEIRVFREGEPEPEAPYLRFEPGGWLPVSGEFRPALDVYLVHPQATGQLPVWQAAQWEAIIYSLFRGPLIPVQTQPAVREQMPIGKNAVERFYSRSLWRMP